MRALGLVGAALSLGAIAWVFLLQAPLLMRRLGRDRFVPLQMGLVRPLVSLSAVASVLMALAVRDGAHAALAGASVVLTLSAALVTPRALRAGAASLRQALDDGAQHSAGRFLSDGGGTDSRVWHRVLGVAMLGLIAVQAAWLAWPA